MEDESRKTNHNIFIKLVLATERETDLKFTFN